MEVPSENFHGMVDPHNMRSAMSICITALLKRRSDITEAEFSDMWKQHGKLVAGLDILQQKVKRYNFIQADSSHNEFLAVIGKSPLPYDGVAQLWVESLQDFIEVMSSEEYKTIAVPDEERFLDSSAMQVIIGEVRINFEKN